MLVVRYAKCGFREAGHPKKDICLQPRRWQCQFSTMIGQIGVLRDVLDYRRGKFLCCKKLVIWHHAPMVATIDSFNSKATDDQDGGCVQKRFVYWHPY